MLVDRKDEVISGTAFRLGFSSKGKSPRRKGREEGMDELDHFLAGEFKLLYGKRKS